MSTQSTHCGTPTVDVEERPYFTSVAVPPYTEENRAAHGGIRIVEQCQECGRRREVNVNGRHVEYGIWQ